MNISFDIFSTAPRNFDVFESTESSITVEWDILESNNCLEYELMYRPDHTDEWKEQFSSVKDVPTKKNGRYMYKIENLSSDTRFEVKMCCGENKRNSHYTRHVSCKTLKHGKKIFGISSQIRSILYTNTHLSGRRSQSFYSQC